MVLELSFVYNHDGMTVRGERRRRTERTGQS